MEKHCNGFLGVKAYLKKPSDDVIVIQCITAVLREVDLEKTTVIVYSYLSYLASYSSYNMCSLFMSIYVFVCECMHLCMYLCMYVFFTHISKNDSLIDIL